MKEGQAVSLGGVLSPSPGSRSAARAFSRPVGEAAALDPPRRGPRLPRVRDTQKETVPAAACSQKRPGFCTASDEERLGLFVLRRDGVSPSPPPSWRIWRSQGHPG